jgi:hypothetical protein
LQLDAVALVVSLAAADYAWRLRSRLVKVIRS